MHTDTIPTRSTIPSGFRELPRDLFKAITPEKFAARCPAGAIVQVAGKFYADPEAAKSLAMRVG